MKRRLDRLSDAAFDVLVVGGGITGAFVAWDATLRGLSVALVEKGDFGEATSSASSKLIHGGIRYLQQGYVGKVRESIVERRAFLRIAPHLLRPIPFLIPTYGRAMRGRAVLSAGMTAYELIGADRNAGMPKASRVEGFRGYGRSEALELEPFLPPDGLTGAVVFPEWHLHDSERMTLACVSGAARRGAVVANHARVVDFLGPEGRVEGARVVDSIGGGEFDVRARVVVNAAGPWAFDLLSRRFRGGVDGMSGMAHSKGCHVIVDRVTNGHAVALATRMVNESIVNRGGRHIFLIPWRDRTLIGTTNVPHEGAPDDLRVTERDVDEFVEEIRSAIPAADITRERVQYAFGGLYPLVDTEVQNTVYQGTGKYRILDHARTDGMEGLVTALGAKYTTARRAAEKCIDRVVSKLGASARPCTTVTTPVEGGDLVDREAAVTAAIAEAPSGLEEDSVRNMVYNYGANWRNVVEGVADERGGTPVPGPAGTVSGPAGTDRVAPDRPTTGAEILWAVREEMAMSLADVVFRRTGLGTIGRPGGDCLQACARLMANELGWTEAQIEHELGEVEAMFSRVS